MRQQRQNKELTVRVELLGSRFLGICRFCGILSLNAVFVTTHVLHSATYADFSEVET